MVVMKFGGSSLGSGKRILHVARVIKRYRMEGRTVVVCSAMSGITNRLLSLVKHLQAGKCALALSEAVSLHEHHRAALQEFSLDCPERYRTAEELDVLGRALMLQVEKLRPGTTSAEAADRIASFGERFSVRLVASALRDLGVKARAVDASDFLVTSADFRNAQPLLPETRSRAGEVLLPLLRMQVLPVVTGFLGATKEGKITTLGRNSSDFSAAVVAHVIDASCVCLWTDVDGVHAKDPRRDLRATVLCELSYDDALGMARNGARVLHPKTLELLREKNIPLWVKNTFRPDFPGTRIGKRANEAAP